MNTSILKYEEKLRMFEEFYCKMEEFVKNLTTKEYIMNLQERLKKVRN